MGGGRLYYSQKAARSNGELVRLLRSGAVSNPCVANALSFSPILRPRPLPLPNRTRAMLGWVYDNVIVWRGGGVSVTLASNVMLSRGRHGGGYATCMLCLQLESSSRLIINRTWS